MAFKIELEGRVLILTKVIQQCMDCCMVVYANPLFSTGNQTISLVKPESPSKGRITHQLFLGSFPLSIQCKLLVGQRDAVDTAKGIDSYYKKTQCYIQTCFLEMLHVKKNKQKGSKRVGSQEDYGIFNRCLHC